MYLIVGFDWKTISFFQSSPHEDGKSQRNVILGQTIWYRIIYTNLRATRPSWKKIRFK